MVTIPWPEPKLICILSPAKEKNWIETGILDKYADLMNLQTDKPSDLHIFSFSIYL